MSRWEDIYWYVVALIIMGAIFLCAYHIGYVRGWSKADNSKRRTTQRLAENRECAKSEWEYEPMPRARILTR